MVHGLIITIHDGVRNITGIGVIPFSPLELLILMIVLLSPYITLNLILHMDKISLINPIIDTRIRNFLLIFFYMLPHISYILWDLRLKKSLASKKIVKIGLFESTNICKWKSGTEYKDFIRVWLGSDVIVLSLLMALILLDLIKRLEIVSLGIIEIALNRSFLLLMFALFHVVLFVSDYLIFNKKFYFPLIED